jgi:predicted outer membrane repeat protein
VNFADLSRLSATVSRGEAMARTSNARLRFRTLVPCCLAFLVSAATPVSVDAATITVNTFNQVDPGQCTLATAISSTNAGADQAGCTHVGTYGTSDTIILAAGTYALTIADNGTNAYPIIQVAIAINGNGATLSRTVGNVAPFFRFFEVGNGGLTIDNLTLTGGNVPGGDGGAILSRTGPLVVTGATFSGNSASGGDGGAIHHRSIEAASITGTTFTNNTASPGGNGGAIFDSSSNGMTLANTTFSGNSASGGNGGAVHDSSVGGLTVTDSAFSDNTATGGDGGAIFDSSSGGLAFNSGTLSNNSVSPGGNGGGIYDSSSGGLRITNVVFTGNTATGGDGGAIYDSSSVGTGPVSNNCIEGNTATISGGGIFRSGAPALNAIDNWWGAATGPSQAGPGTGDAVSPDVTFAPFLTSAPSICSTSPPSSTTTTTTLPGATCNQIPDGATFASIDCRLDQLVASLNAAQDLGRLKNGIVKAATKARTKKQQAEGFVATGKKKQEKNAMKKAVKVLSSFLHKAGSRSARKLIPPATRQMLSDQATPILADMKTLLRTL